MAKPVISVIIPVYKTEKYLDRCVKSVVNQTYKNLEIILVDDGSPDNCPAMCDSWAKQDKRIRVLHLENGGAANARNMAMKQVKGEFIAFVDSDDYLEPDIYEILLSLMKESNADIAICDFQINDEQRGVCKKRVIDSKSALKLVVTGNYKFGVLWNKLYKMSIIKDVAIPNLKLSEDLLFNYFVMKKANCISEISLKLYHYFQNSESSVHMDFGISNIDAVKAREIIINDTTEGELFKYAVKGYLLSCFVFIDGIILNNKCKVYYSKLRKEIMKYRKYVFLSPIFSNNDRIKILIFWLFPYIYYLIIKITR